MLLGILFTGASGVACVFRAPPWAALHLLLAGGLGLAISGMSLMLTVTWSAAPAPSDWVAWCQRTCLAIGVLGLVVARSLGNQTGLAAISGVLYVSGLLILAVQLSATARHGVERRFDPAVWACTVALLAGIAGASIGVVMAVRGATAPWRAVHAALNVLGFVGITVTGTLPFFAATVVRARMAPVATGRRIVLLVVWQAATVVVTAGGLAARADAVASVGLAAHALGACGVIGLLPRPSVRQLRWAGPRMVALWAGCAWWALAVGAAAVETWGAGRGLTRPWLSVLVVAGFGQILWASISYAVPMLRGGGHERLSQGFAMTRSWVSLIAGNVAGIAIADSLSLLAHVSVAVWATDTMVRLARVGLGGRHRQRWGTAPG